MKNRDRFRKLLPGLPLIALAAAVALVATGCDGSTTVSPNAPIAAPAAASVLSAQVVGAMNRGIQDEYLAEAIYLGVIAKFGDVQPFSNIVFAEERHSAAIATLFRAYGLVMPDSQWPDSDIPRFDSLSAACAAAVQAEISNIGMYDEFSTYGDLPSNVLTVFESNRAASLNNHLPAFEACCACNQ